MEITMKQLECLNEVEYLLIDIRAEWEYQNGFIPGAVSKQVDDFDAYLPKDKMIVIYCRKGQHSEEVAFKLREDGFDAYHLTGGYVSWLMDRVFDGEEIVKAEQTSNIEESIRKKFKKAIFSQFTRAIRTYKLVEAGDRIAICISGGKDSMLMAKLFQELTKHRQIPFEPVFLVMDPGYAPENRALIERNARIMGIPITVFETDIFESVENVPKSACYLCARMRRGHLYSKAKSLGCNKIALGHHYDDVIETILMGMLWGAQVQTMMPKLRSDNFEGMELIRPLYFVREADIKRFRDYHDLHFLQCACRFTDTCSVDGSMASKRTEIKALISEMKKTNPLVESHIFSSVENVHMDAVISYKKDGERVHFLDRY